MSEQKDHNVSEKSSDKALSMHYGLATAQLIESVYDEGADRAVIMMRHSARTFNRDIHDLLNLLTDHGRELADALGTRMPKDILLKGYSSPAERCIETAERIIAQHQQAGGAGARTRVLEVLGVFYALDQGRMWKGLSQANGLAAYVESWFAGDVGRIFLCLLSWRLNKS